MARWQRESQKTNKQTNNNKRKTKKNTTGLEGKTTTFLSISWLFFCTTTP